METLSCQNKHFQTLFIWNPLLVIRNISKLFFDMEPISCHNKHFQALFIWKPFPVITNISKFISYGNPFSSQIYQISHTVSSGQSNSVISKHAQQNSSHMRDPLPQNQSQATVIRCGSFWQLRPRLIILIFKSRL